MDFESKRTVSLILAIAIFVLGIAAIFVFDRVSRTDGNLPEGFLQESEALERERNRLNGLLNTVKYDMTSTIGCGAFLSLLMEEPNAAVYSVIYQKMRDPAGDGSEAPLTGIIALSPDRLPGMEGNMSREEFFEMLNAGWSYIIRYSDAEEPVESFLDRSAQALATLGLSLPNAIYFDYDCYTVDLNPTLEQLGIKYAVHHGEDRTFCIELDWGDGLLLPGATGWNTFGLSTGLVPELVGEGGYSLISMGFTPGYTSFFEADYILAVESYGRMIDRFVEYRRDNRIIIGSLNEGFAQRNYYMSEYEKMLPDIEARKEELKAQIAEVDSKLVDLHTKYFG